MYSGHLPNGGASQHWAEVTASSLIGVDGEGNVIEPGNVGGYPELSAKCIHLGIRKIRPNAKVIWKSNLDSKSIKYYFIFFIIH